MGALRAIMRLERTTNDSGGGESRGWQTDRARFACLFATSLLRGPLHGGIEQRCKDAHASSLSFLDYVGLSQ